MKRRVVRGDHAVTVALTTTPPPLETGALGESKVGLGCESNDGSFGGRKRERERGTV